MFGTMRKQNTDCKNIDRGKGQNSDAQEAWKTRNTGETKSRKKAAVEVRDIVSLWGS